MPRARSTVPALLSLATLLATTTRARAQAPADLSPQSVRGLASVSVAGDAAWQGGSPFQWSGGVGYAPFLTEHWQVGAVVGTAGHGRNGSLGGTSTGSATALVNYWIGANRRSRPHVGAFATATEVSGRSDITGWGGSVGWSHFVTPFVALDASFAGERYSYDPRTHTALRVGLQPYVSGRAAGAGFMGARPQARGALDLAFDARAVLSPVRLYTLRLGAAPFFLRALQVGGTLNASHWRDDVLGRRRRVTDHELEGFARLYYPTDGMLHPFAGAFASTATRNLVGTREGSRGASAGVRAYLNPGLALDLSLERRHFTGSVPVDGVSRRPNRLGMRLGLTSHLPRRAGP